MSERPPADDQSRVESGPTDNDDGDDDSELTYKPIVVILVFLAVAALVVFNPSLSVALLTVLPQLAIVYLLYRLVGEVGRVDAARKVAEGLVAAAEKRGNDRLPELFAGFEREQTEVPVSYGEACEPQAWAAAAPLAFLQAVAGTVAEVPDEPDSRDAPTPSS